MREILDNINRAIYSNLCEIIIQFIFSKAKHLSDFIAQVYANTVKSQISAIGTILHSQNITPTLPTLPSDILNYNSSTITSTVNTAFVGTTYLDSFTVVFMDLSYNIKYEVSVSTNKSVDLTSHIDTLISVLPSEFYWGIKVNQYASSATSSSYTIETTKKCSYVDIYLMLIDPRRADDDRYVPKVEKLKSSIYNDDGGGNLHAKISIGSHATEFPYLIIASTYSYSVSGNFYIKISGMDTSHIIIL